MSFSLADLAPAVRSVVSGVLTGVSDPQLGYMWEVEINTRTRSHDHERSLFLYARNCTIPQRSVEQMSRRFIGEEVSHPGHSIEPRTFQATFWDDKKLVGYRYFNQWLNIISDPTYGKQVSDSHLRRDIKIRLKDRTDFFTGALIELRGAYITTVGDVTMSYEESIPFIFNVTLKYDELIINGTEYDIGESARDQNMGVVSSVNRFISNGIDDLFDF